ncbi:hypothetical protein ACFYNO_26035 [Kitasatospora sp. NPDC006697]|uniref:terpene synthase family protein n=1 Tax=Kitasatospora sp. NPDC006697 TaxID=3364020 RepID=UPI0036B6BF71
MRTDIAGLSARMSPGATLDGAFLFSDYLTLSVLVDDLHDQDVRASRGLAARNAALRAAVTATGPVDDPVGAALRDVQRRFAEPAPAPGAARLAAETDRTLRADAGDHASQLAGAAPGVDEYLRRRLESTWMRGLITIAAAVDATAPFAALLDHPGIAALAAMTCLMPPGRVGAPRRTAPPARPAPRDDPRPAGLGGRQPAVLHAGGAGLLGPAPHHRPPGHRPRPATGRRDRPLVGRRARRVAGRQPTGGAAAAYSSAVTGLSQEALCLLACPAQCPSALASSRLFIFERPWMLRCRASL